VKSVECKVHSVKCRVRSAKCKVRSVKRRGYTGLKPADLFDYLFIIYFGDLACSQCMFETKMPFCRPLCQILDGGRMLRSYFCGHSSFKGSLDQ